MTLKCRNSSTSSSDRVNERTDSSHTSQSPKCSPMTSFCFACLLFFISVNDANLHSRSMTVLTGCFPVIWPILTPFILNRPLHLPSYQINPLSVPNNGSGHGPSLIYPTLRHDGGHLPHPLPGPPFLNPA